jgi:hypothetical protein
MPQSDIRRLEIEVMLCDLEFARRKQMLAELRAVRNGLALSNEEAEKLHAVTTDLRRDTTFFKKTREALKQKLKRWKKESAPRKKRAAPAPRPATPSGVRRYREGRLVRTTGSPTA